VNDGIAVEVIVGSGGKVGVSVFVFVEVGVNVFVGRGVQVGVSVIVFHGVMVGGSV